MAGGSRRRHVTTVDEFDGDRHNGDRHLRSPDGRRGFRQREEMGRDRHPFAAVRVSDTASEVVEPDAVRTARTDNPSMPVTADSDTAVRKVVGVP